ncbi:MAG: hypothetical protein NTV08_11525 [Verrucomicrobia bacterium]|nr:hypothetical protein [Verrucomicrobiota bacterium]
MESRESHTSDGAGGRAALVVAHPGHELRVFHWMELHRPLFFCITDGSGGAGEPRTASTSKILDTVGSAAGPIFGRHPDRHIYRLLLDGRTDVFADLARELAQALASAQVTAVAGDAVEGFNPAHDVCRFIIDGAVEMLRRGTGRILQNQDFLLDSLPDACPGHLRDGATRLVLDSAAVDRKIRPPHSPTPVPVLTVSGAAGAKAISCGFTHRLWDGCEKISPSPIPQKPPA